MDSEDELVIVGQRMAEGPITAMDAVFQAPFPSYARLDKCVEDGGALITFWAEVDEGMDYTGMKEMLARWTRPAQKTGCIHEVLDVYMTSYFCSQI